MAVGQPPWMGLFGGEAKAQLKPRLVEVAQRLRSLKGHVAGVKVAIGDPVTETVRAARQLGADLIMIGAGAGAVTDPGSCAEPVQALARQAPTDVWICKPHADACLEHVLCAADTTARAGDAVVRGVQIGRRFNARLRLLSVLPEPETARNGEDAEMRVQAQRQAQRDFLQQFDLQGVALSRAMVWGSQAAVEILIEAERFSDGLLVVGASSDPRTRATGLGVTVERVLRLCPSSLLIVKQRVVPDRTVPAPEPEPERGTTVA
jgi:nucleotide-binding universal stress UspA family protein